MAGLREAVACGYRGVEFDVMLTADDVPVLIHDADFGRTIAGRGSVASTTWDELARRDAGSWFGPRFAGEPVPRYDDVVRFCIEHGLWMNVEIKPSPGREAETGRIVGETTVALDAKASHVLFSSFSTVALDEVAKAAARQPRGLLVRDVQDDTARRARSMKCVSVHADHRRLDPRQVEGLEAVGLAVMAYTVNAVDRATLLSAWGVDAICTDRIDTIDPTSL